MQYNSHCPVLREGEREGGERERERMREID